ncbi:unnamed protein product [Caenorhabditis sp. 36 PRJEB53466]|nr:unnamed protein product [Caenorhabditis sp. 36 PRJEB53466]
MEVCKLFNRLVYFVVERSLGDVKRLDPYVLLKIVALWGGRLCLLVFFAALLIVTFVVAFVIIPAEWSVCESVPYFVFRLCVSFFVYYNVIFHYYKARTLKPVKNPGSARDQFCIKCNSWKSASTSHCKACDACIYRMDHHCPHIGQCVGAHNQANFFLFLFYLLVGTGLFFLFAPSFWWDWIQVSFCSVLFADSCCRNHGLQS